MLQPYCQLQKLLPAYRLAADQNATLSVRLESWSLDDNSQLTTNQLIFVVPVAAAESVTTNDPAAGTTFFMVAVASLVPIIANTRLAAVTREFVTVTVVPAAAMEQRPDGVLLV